MQDFALTTATAQETRPKKGKTRNAVLGMAMAAASVGAHAGVVDIFEFSLYLNSPSLNSGISHFDQRIPFGPGDFASGLSVAFGTTGISGNACDISFGPCTINMSVWNGTGITLQNTRFFTYLDADMGISPDGETVALLPSPVGPGLSPGQTFEADDLLTGNLISNLFAGNLDGAPGAFGDATFAFGFDIGDLLNYQTIAASFTISQSGQVLQLDEEGNYFLASASAQIPEPVSPALLGLGLVAMLPWLRLRS